MKNFREIATSLPAQAYNSLVSIIAKTELMGQEDLNAFMEAITLTAFEEQHCEVTLALLNAAYDYVGTIKKLQFEEIGS